MKLNINEMKALKSVCEFALNNDTQQCDLSLIPIARDRWELIKRYLAEIDVHVTHYGTSVYFDNEALVIALLCRIKDEIADAEKEQKLRWWQTFAYVSAIISAICALLVFIFK